MASRLAKGIVLLVVSFFFIYPLLKLILLGVQTGHGTGISNFVDILSDPRTWIAIKNTLLVAAGSTLISAVIGFGLAWVCAYTNIRNKGWIHLLALMPFIIPSYIMTLAWTQLAGPTGLLNKWVSDLLGHKTVFWDVYGLDGIVVVMGLTHYPLVYLLTKTVLYRIPKDLEWAARASGASKWQVFRKVTVPLAVSGLAGGGLLAFIASLDNFGIPAFLGIPAGVSVLSTLIYEQVAGFGPSAFSRAAALSGLLGVLALLGTGIQWLIVRRAATDTTTIEDKGIRCSLGRKRGWVEAVIWSFLTITSVVPLLAMFSTAVIRAYGLPFTFDNLTWKHFLFVLDGNEASKRAISNSLALAGWTTAICLVIGTLLAYWRIKKPEFFVKSLEAVVSIPYALPGMVVALAMIFTWLQPLPGWNPGVYGTIWILLIAYITRFMILQMRSSAASILQIGPEAEEAARIHGGRLPVRWGKILVPLILPGILTGALLVFLTSLSELTVSSLLWSSGAETIGVIIFNFEQAGSTTYSTAFSTLLVFGIALTLSIGHFVKQRWTRRLEQ